MGMLKSIIAATIVTCLIALTSGCARHQALLPNSDPSLRRSGAEFAADAKARHPYPDDLPHAGEAPARAQIAYMLNRIELVNLDVGDWEDVEIWVNRGYVVHLPAVENRRLKRISFMSLMDANGQHFPLSRAFIEQLEVVKDGRRYSVHATVAH
jgi:hypothetical protein